MTLTADRIPGSIPSWPVDGWLRVLAASFVLLAGAAGVQAEPLVTPPDGFWIRSAELGASGLYGPTRPSDSWHVTQWQTPAADLPAFAPEPCSATACFASSNDAITVSVTEQGNAPLRYVLEQTGERLACETGQRQPREFDLLVASNTHTVYPDQPTAFHSSPMLADMVELRHRIVVTPLEVHVWQACAFNHGQLLTAVILRNDVAKPAQILFYQLRLFREPGRHQPVWWWPGNERRGKDGEVVLLEYGFGDNLSSYGEDEARLGEETRIDIDLLPRLAALISSGVHGLDPDLSHWRPTSTYHGQNLWGGVALRSEWWGFELSAELAR